MGGWGGEAGEGGARVVREGSWGGESWERFMRSWQGKSGRREMGSGRREMGGGGCCQAASGRGTVNEYCGVL